MSARWTPARVEALRAFALDGTARESNETKICEGYANGRSFSVAIVHWQSLRFLWEQGLAARVSGADAQLYELTAAGVAMLAQLGPPAEQLDLEFGA